MQPVAEFTIPSVSDDLPLDCRVYHPKNFSPAAGATQCDWGKRGAIIAHPYAPLGGCYDDPVVSMIAQAFLEAGYIVGTFNFRGAGDSKGRTSWTSKPELSDYISFAGFFVYYLHEIQPRTQPRSSHINGPVSEPELSPIISSIPLNTSEPTEDASATTLVLGGYSYGSMIVAQLPTTNRIVEKFSASGAGSAEAEIHLRASKLAAEHNHEFELNSRSRSLRKSCDFHPMKLGGEESEPGSRRRRSHDSHPSIDAFRKSFDISRSMSTHSRSQRESTDDVVVTNSTFQLPRTCYLLVSPLLPPVSSLATFFSFSSGQTRPECQINGTDKLCYFRTMAIFGIKDMFTSSGKLRKWGSSMHSRPGSHFVYKENPTAGHFWLEPQAGDQLTAEIRSWASSI